MLGPRGVHMLREEPVAQPVEHLTFNQGVSGSNPDGLTNNTKELTWFHLPSNLRWEAHGKTDRYLTMDEVGALYTSIFPGVTIRKHLLWRYSAVWLKT